MGQLNARIEDRYFIQKVKLGEGAFGTVWRAIDRQMQEVVAIKQLDKNKMLARRVQREDLEREVCVMTLCMGPNLLRLLNTFEDDANFFMALEYCDGGDFGDKLRERSLECPESEAASWMRDIINAIEALHAAQVCHRDVKPDNFMVAGTILKLADFGLSCFLPPTKVLHEKCGTPAYMAPELHQLPGNSRGYSLPVDMWATGVILYMIMNGGRQPFVAAGGQVDQRALLEGRLDFGNENLLNMSMLGFNSRFSDAARQLCKGLVDVHSEVRMTAAEALQHPWMTGDHDTAGRWLRRTSSSAARTITPPPCARDSLGRMGQVTPGRRTSSRCNNIRWDTPRMSSRAGPHCLNDALEEGLRSTCCRSPPHPMTPCHRLPVFIAPEVGGHVSYFGAH
jgi:calcium-dependent protein kinase